VTNVEEPRDDSNNKTVAVVSGKNNSEEEEEEINEQQQMPSMSREDKVPSPSSLNSSSHVSSEQQPQQQRPRKKCVAREPLKRSLIPNVVAKQRTWSNKNLFTESSKKQNNVGKQHGNQARRCGYHENNKPGSRKSISEQLEDIFTPLEDMDTNMMRMSPSSCTPPPPSPPSSNKLASPCTRRKYNNKVTTKVNPATYENYNSSNTNNQKQQQHQQNNNSTNVAAENQRKITTAMPVRQHQQQQQQQDQHLYQQSRSVPAASCRVAVRSNLSNLSHTGGAGAVGMSPKLAPRARREVAPPPPPVTMTTVARNYGTTSSNRSNFNSSSASTTPEHTAAQVRKQQQQQQHINTSGAADNMNTVNTLRSQATTTSSNSQADPNKPLTALTASDLKPKRRPKRHQQPGKIPLRAAHPYPPTTSCATSQQQQQQQHVLLRHTPQSPHHRAPSSRRNSYQQQQRNPLLLDRTEVAKLNSFFATMGGYLPTASQASSREEMCFNFAEGESDVSWDGASAYVRDDDDCEFEMTSMPQLSHAPNVSIIEKQARILQWITSCKRSQLHQLQPAAAAPSLQSSLVVASSGGYMTPKESSV